MKDLLFRYFLYLVRWQLSTPILAPVVAYFKNSPSMFGTLEDWIGSAVANVIGGLIFFWVDKFIFKSPILDVWEHKAFYTCDCCGEKVNRAYRLVKTNGYDKTKDKTPKYLCETCSIAKYNAIKNGLTHPCKVGHPHVV